MGKTAEDVIDEFLDKEYDRQKAGVDDPRNKKTKAKGLVAPKERSEAEAVIDSVLKPRPPGIRSADEMQEMRDTYRKRQEQTQEPGLGEAVGEGLAAGGAGIMADIGTMAVYAGEKFGSDTLVELGEEQEDYWEKVRQKYEAPESLQGDVVKEDGSVNWDLISKPTWWAYHVAQMAPSLAASVLPAAAVFRGIQWGSKALKTVSVVDKAGKTRKLKQLNLAGKKINFKPEHIDKLARVGAGVAGGLVGGALEGSSTYREVLERGGTHEEAAAAAELMTLASGALNAISLDFILKRLPDTAMGRLKKRFWNGAVEAVTEYLEGPAEGMILMEGADGASYEYTAEEFGDKMRQELNVFGPAFVLGFFMPVGQLRGTPSKGDKDKDKDKDTTPPPEPDTTDDTGAPGPKEEIEFTTEELGLQTPGAAPEAAAPTSEETIEGWVNQFDPTQYDPTWDQDQKDMHDLIAEAAQYDPTIVDDLAWMIEQGADNENIFRILNDIINTGVKLRDEQQAQQEGGGGAQPVSGEQGQGVPAPETGGQPTTTATGQTGTIGEGAGPAVAEEPVTEEEPTEGELTPEQQEIEDLLAEEDTDLEAQLEEAELEAELEEAEAEPEATTGEKPVEDMTDEELEDLIAQAEDEVKTGRGEQPTTTAGEGIGPTTPQPAGEPAEPTAGEPTTTAGEGAVAGEEVAGEPAPEPAPETTAGEGIAEPTPTEPETTAEPAEEEAAAEKPAGRKYSENDYAKLAGKEVLIQEPGEKPSKQPAAKVLRDIDNRLSALEAFKECMGQ